MTTSSSWRDVKAKARAADPEGDSPERAARRAEMREQLLKQCSTAASPR